MKVQPPKLPYPAHNTCSVIVFPSRNPDDASSRLLCADVPHMDCKTSGVAAQY
ncbi:hypothetical protein PILCRDRAFT_15696 [Piloderma croceum F 1598]|uniref:Uncharacterized protein n=1 Tax=Piloderma croceum (strain F 1598) TaxID=765440 RepID=A0A0C3AGJ1_PILCF|nr:hypothetical protein PILCRDRAFT_15696 [Piloderma croceum F 1598]